MVRSHLNYCSSVWATYRKGDTDALEIVQKRATKIVPALKNLPYGESLKICKMPSIHYRHTHTHTTILWPFFWDHPGELVPEENFWTLAQWKINRGRHTDRPARRHSIRTNQSSLSPSPHFFRGWMPFLPPNQHCQSTEGN